MTRFVVLLMIGLLGCGDNLAPLEPSASGIFPSEAFLGRRQRVEISGVGTHWDENVGVDFGDGIGVGTISVASPTTIFADIAIEDTTLPGLHTVTITDGAEVLTLDRAFLLLPPIALHLQGNIAQGAIGLFSIINRDFDAPFDTSSFQTSIFEAPVFVNLAISGPAGVTFAIDEVTPYTITGVVQIDVDAVASGPVEVVSGPADQAIRSPLGSSISITPRAALPLVAPTTTRTVVMPFDSHLYAFTPAMAPHVARFAVSAAEERAAPRIAILGPSGHFADALATSVTRSTQVAVTAATTYYAIYFDGRGTAGYDYTLAASSQALVPVTELEPNDGPASAQAEAPPLLFGPATLADQADEDWLAVEIGALDVGKRIHVITTGDPRTDTGVDVRSPTLDSLGGPSNDANYHEDFTSTPTSQAGTHLVRISASQSVFFDPMHNTYAAAIFLE